MGTSGEALDRPNGRSSVVQPCGNIFSNGKGLERVRRLPFAVRFQHGLLDQKFPAARRRAWV